MKRVSLLAALAVLGLCAGPFASFRAVAQATDEPNDDNSVAALKDELDSIRGALPAQAVAMTVVEYNYSNLWFAAHEKNLPLAKFLLSETRARLRWALRITPERRISTGTVVLQPFLDAFEQGPYAAIEKALDSNDIAGFEAAYKDGLGACQSCHAASEKPYLRLQTPSQPASPLIDFAID
jgi:hypothetical protein